MGGDVFHNRAQAVFIISKISFCTKPTVILSFSTTASFQLKPTVPKAVLSPKSSFRLVSNVVVTLHIVLNYNDSDDDAVHRSESDNVWE